MTGIIHAQIITVSCYSDLYYVCIYCIQPTFGQCHFLSGVLCRVNGKYPLDALYYVYLNDDLYYFAFRTTDGGHILIAETDLSGIKTTIISCEISQMDLTKICMKRLHNIVNELIPNPL